MRIQYGGRAERGVTQLMYVGDDGTAKQPCKACVAVAVVAGLLLVRALLK